jgi:hypothetical protein
VNAASEAEAQCVEYEIFAIILRSHGSGLDPELIVRDVVRKTKVAIARKIAAIFPCVCVADTSFDAGTDKPA